MERLNTEYWDDELSAIASQMVQGIENVLSELPSKRIEVSRPLRDSFGVKICSIELIDKNDGYGEEAYIKTEKGESRIAEEDVTILMSIAMYINMSVIPKMNEGD